MFFKFKKKGGEEKKLQKQRKGTAPPKKTLLPAADSGRVCVLGGEEVESMSTFPVDKGRK